MRFLVERELCGRGGFGRDLLNRKEGNPITQRAVGSFTRGGGTPLKTDSPTLHSNSREKRVLLSITFPSSAWERSTVDLDEVGKVRKTAPAHHQERKKIVSDITICGRKRAGLARGKSGADRRGVT